MATSGHFGCPKITFDGISGHFRSIQNFVFEFLAKLLPFWMSEILAISDRYATLIFGNFLTKWLVADILDVRKSRAMAFLAISDRSAILDV